MAGRHLTLGQMVGVHPDVIVETRRALNQSQVHVTLLNLPTSQVVVALSQSGALLGTEDTAEVVSLMYADGVAAVVSELTALMKRIGGDTEAEFNAALGRRYVELHKAGQLKRGSVKRTEGSS